jgi:uncharacterized protein (TIGR03086 family)
MEDVQGFHARAVQAFGEHVRAIGDDRWSGATPCADWDVRALVNHLVGENLWTPPLFDGRTIADVGDAFDGDVLGADARAAWAASAGPAVDAVQGDGAMDRTVHLSFGDFEGRFYAWQLFFDFLVHGWDLARAIGADERMDPELVDAALAWFGDMEPLYRQGGAISDRPDIPIDADPQTRLLAMSGRTA